jgi:arsenite-transporting ATPase
VGVLLPEELSLFQTLRLMEGLATLHVPITDLIVNQVYPGNSTCPVCSDIRARQAKMIGQIAVKFSGRALWQAPLWPAEVCGPEPLALFWKTIRPLEIPQSGTSPASVLPIQVETPAPLPGPDVRLLLLAGKGGVGKSTLACATALRLAETYPGQRVLLFSTDPAHSLSGCLAQRVGPTETEICPGLWAVEIDASAELAELKTHYAREVAGFFQKLGDRGGLSVEFDAPLFERVMDLAPPGLDEVMALARVARLVQASVYDRFVLDTAPSGHLIRLLETPALIEDWLKVVFGLLLKYRKVLRLPRTGEWLVELSRGIKALRGLLTDAARSKVFAVSLLTDLGLEKTEELLGACRRLGLSVPVLFLNQATPASPCVYCVAQRGQEERLRDRFAQELPGLHQSVIDRDGPLHGLDRLSQLGHEMYEATFSPLSPLRRGAESETVVTTPAGLPGR